MTTPRVPSVEDRILQVEQALAMLLMLSRAHSTADDPCLGAEDVRAAWAGVDHVVEQALADVRASARVLPPESLFLDAPDADAESGGVQADASSPS